MTHKNEQIEIGYTSHYNCNYSGIKKLYSQVSRAFDWDLDRDKKLAR